MEKLKKHIHDDSNGLGLCSGRRLLYSRLTAAGGKLHHRTMGTDGQGIYLQEYCSDRYNELLTVWKAVDISC